MFDSEQRGPGTGAHSGNSMSPAQSIRLTALMERTSGSPDFHIGLIDGPVFTQHPDFNAAHLRGLTSPNGATCAQTESMACLHGTFIAGVLSAKRTSPAPALCPDCTLLLRPIFSETSAGREHMPAATPGELARAILDCIQAGARVINLSVALAQPSTRGEAISWYARARREICSPRHNSTTPGWSSRKRCGQPHLLGEVHVHA